MKTIVFIGKGRKIYFGCALFLCPASRVLSSFPHCERLLLAGILAQCNKTKTIISGPVTKFGSVDSPQL